MLENEKTAIVIDMYLSLLDTSKQNTEIVAMIAEKTGLKESRVRSVINKYLDNLKVEHEEI
ncbi:hypothetical protein MHM83_10975 [Tenacibaculum sp. Mcav3-52]|uniref:hypothetical protein n=1 Tax=Tenacibaculum sp. Mcav3-52 TaxID=2917762 RepID=UPI001EF1C826|nr:hypothetical protein [Tenacibaculum sp. Mcav3-52]MCG7502395.1 hypothetical protein [Tenacibaculum sp. Mcav3-52]